MSSQAAVEPVAGHLLSLRGLRRGLAQSWLIALFAIAYLVSQVSIILILAPIAQTMVHLQTTGVSAADYLVVFEQWQSTGEMAFYRAHFVLDDIHWIWYAGLFTTLLCWLFERHGIADRRNWVLLLPLASGLLDWYENRLQHVFLETELLTTIVDPLPLLSTAPSDLKWLLSLIYMALSAALLVRWWRQSAS